MQYKPAPLRKHDLRNFKKIVEKTFKNSQLLVELVDRTFAYYLLNLITRATILHKTAQTNWTHVRVPNGNLT